MCAKAEEWDYIHAFGPQGATAHRSAPTLTLSHSRVPPPPSPSKPSPNPSYDPMAMEIDNINLANIDPTTRLLFMTMNSFGVALNAMSQQLNKFGSNNYNNRQQKALGKLTPEETAATVAASPTPDMSLPIAPTTKRRLSIALLT